jgi:tetratricopeptide (TPR) repeat protein
MLDTHCQRKDEAEERYRQCITVEPRHSYSLYNLAVLLEDKYSKVINTDGDYDALKAVTPKADSRAARRNSEVAEVMKLKEEVCDLYRRAVEADPQDPTTTADYGRYVAKRRRR